MKRSMSPLLTASLTMRITLYMQLLKAITRQVARTKIRNFALFKMKRAYFSFRPWQKIQQHARNKKQQDESNMKQAFDRLHSMLLCVGLLKVRYKVPKVKQKDQELKGILAVNAPEKVKIVTYSLKDGI